MSLLAGTAYVDVLPNTDKFGSALQGKLKGIGSSLTSVGKKLSLGLTAPLVAFGTAAVAEATDAAKIARQTEAILQSSGNSAVLTAEQIDRVSASIMDYAAVDDDAAKSTANLLLGMVDLTKFGSQADEMLQMMTTSVYDLAAGMNKSESFVTRLMGKIANSPAAALTTLKNLNVVTAEEAERFKEMADNGEAAAVSQILLTKVSKKYAGQAGAAATDQQRFAVALQQLSESIGKVLLPFVEKISNALKGLVERFQNLSPEAQKTIVFVGVLAAALGPVLLLLGGFAKAISNIADVVPVLGKAFTGLGKVWTFLAAHPFIIAIAALAIIAFLIIKNWDKVKAFFIAAFNAIGKTVKAVVDSVKAWFGGAAEYVSDKWQALVTFFRELPGKVGDAFVRVKDAIINAFKAAVNFIIGAWNALDFGIHVSIPTWVPVFGGRTYGVDDIFPDIPYLAKGGVVRQPTLAMVGEAGPEAVVPLSRLGANEAKLTITDWRRGIGTLEYELDRLALVRGD